MGWPGPMTHRQFLTWHAWLAMEWSRPSRSDYYQMQTACEVRRVLSKKPRQVKIKHFHLEFDGSDRPRMSQEQAVAWSKAKWGALAAAAQAKDKPKPNASGENGTTRR